MNGTAIFAQQNLFNMPSGEITPEGKFYVQNQINASASSVQSNTTFDYGIGHDMEIGVNLFFLNFSTNTPIRNQRNSSDEILPKSPLILGNMQKAFKLTDSFKMTFGGQAGGNAGDPDGIEFAYLGYGTAVFHEGNTGINLHIGLYRGNVAYNGSGDGFLMGGAEVPIMPRKLHLLGDLIQGQHANAVMVPGLLWFVTERLSLSIGWQKPFPQSNTEQAVVFELSYL